MTSMEFIFMWLLTAFGLWLVTRVVPGVKVYSARGLWLGALVLGLVNAFIRPVLWILTLPLSVLTFGLFALVVNAFMIKLSAWLVPDFEVKGFWSAFVAAFVMAILSLFGYALSQLFTLGEVQWIVVPSQPNGMYL